MVVETINHRITNSAEQTLDKEVMSTYDLPALIRNMKHCSAWMRDGLNTQILQNKDDKRIVLIALNEDTEIMFKKSEDAISFHVLEGVLNIHANTESVYLVTGQFLTFYKNAQYCLSTTEETTFLLVMNKVNSARM